MDDAKFDKIIKQKIGEYESNSFEPSDLAALHHQIAAATHSRGLFKYSATILTGLALLVCTSAIILNQWHIKNQNYKSMQSGFEDILAQNKILKEQIEDLRRLTYRDTVEYRHNNDAIIAQHQVLLARISSLESSLNAIKNSDRKVTDYEMIHESDPPQIKTDDLSGISQDVLFPFAKVGDGEGKQTSHHERNLGVKELRAMEKHYHHGLGIRMAPTAELSKTFVPNGSGGTNLMAGVSAEFILSPSWSIEAGAKYGVRYFEAEANALQNFSFPDIDPALGILDVAEVDSWTIEMPFNLRYRYPLSMNSHLIAGTGYSAMLYLKQSFEYNYRYIGNSEITVFSSSDYNDASFYPGTINAYIGLDFGLRNKKSLEGGIVYQRSLGHFGLEGSRPNYLGFRGAYWFRIK